MIRARGECTITNYTGPEYMGGGGNRRGLYWVWEEDGDDWWAKGRIRIDEWNKKQNGMAGLESK